MKGALLFIGDELITGRILNTNAEFAGKILSAFGLEPEEIVTIPDIEDKIINTLRRLIEEYDFVITSGGLGPTEDDLTTQAVAKALDLPLKEDKALLAAILASSEYKDTLAMASKMALMPEGAQALSEDSKVVGFALTYRDKRLFFLPGVPSQFQDLLKNKVIPQLCLWKTGGRTLECGEGKVFKSFIFFDLNETDLNRFIQEIPSKEGLKIGYYPLLPEVRLVVFGREEEIKNITEQIKERFKLNLVGEEEDSLPQGIGKLLRERRETLATAESCTGGYLASLITSIAGSSDYFDRGFITYTAKSKSEILGVKEETLTQQGVYSYETAIEMALGAKRLSHSTYALATTGVAGPTGGTPQIPVGTVFIALATPQKVYAFKFYFEGNRNTIQRVASYTALDILRRYLLYGEGFFSYRFAQGFKERPL